MQMCKCTPYLKWKSYKEMPATVYATSLKVIYLTNLLISVDKLATHVVTTEIVCIKSAKRKICVELKPI